MNILFFIVVPIFLLIIVILMVQLLRVRNAFRSMLIKFVNVNQTFYENQKMIIGKFSNLILSLDKSICEMRDTLQKNKINFDNQTQIIKDHSVKLLALTKKVESYSSEVGTMYEQFARKSTTTQSTKPKP